MRFSLHLCGVNRGPRTAGQSGPMTGVLRLLSGRLPVAMIEGLKILANQRDLPYQSLLKVFLAERLEKERALKRVG